VNSQKKPGRKKKRGKTGGGRGEKERAREGNNQIIHAEQEVVQGKKSKDRLLDAETCGEKRVSEGQKHNRKRRGKQI